MPRHILFVHGVGDAPFKIAETFKNNIAKETIHDSIQFHAFFWKSLISKKEEQIKRKLGRFPKIRLLLSLNPNIKESIETYLIVQLRRFLIGYFGDAVFYLSESSGKVKSQLEKALLEIKKKDKNARISLVAHSLGSVIAFDLLSDKKFQKRMARRGILIENLFTVGSPLPLFLLRSETGINSTLPITGRWINIHDKRDIIASPLSPFFDQCRDFQVKVQNSNPLTAHSNYFSDPIVLNEILKNLI